MFIRFVVYFELVGWGGVGGASADEVHVLTCSYSRGASYCHRKVVRPPLQRLRLRDCSAAEAAHIVELGCVGGKATDIHVLIVLGLSGNSCCQKKQAHDVMIMMMMMMR